MLPLAAPNNTRGGASHTHSCVVFIVVCDQVNRVDPAHQANKVDEVHEVHQVHEIDEVHQVKQLFHLFCLLFGDMGVSFCVVTGNDPKTKAAPNGVGANVTFLSFFVENKLF